MGFWGIVEPHTCSLSLFIKCFWWEIFPSPETMPSVWRYRSLPSPYPPTHNSFWTDWTGWGWSKCLEKNYIRLRSVPSWPLDSGPGGSSELEHKSQGNGWLFGRDSFWRGYLRWFIDRSTRHPSHHFPLDAEYTILVLLPLIRLRGIGYHLC